MTVTATYEGAEIARSDHYFPVDDIVEGVLRPSGTHSVCPWKGQASYYDVVVADRRNHDATCYYPDPKEAAKEIAHLVAFWKGIEVRDG